MDEGRFAGGAHRPQFCLESCSTLALILCHFPRAVSDGCAVQLGQNHLGVAKLVWGADSPFSHEMLGKSRRLSKDYERCPLTTESIIYLASIHTLLKRLPTQFSDGFQYL